MIHEVAVQFLASLRTKWIVQSTNNLVAVRVNNTGDALAVMGSPFPVFTGVAGERVNDKTDVYPDLSPTRKGWVAAWRRLHNDLTPATVMLKIAAIAENEAVGAVVNVTPVYDQDVMMVDNPALIVRDDGTAVTVHQQTPQTGVDAGKTSLALTLNAGSLGAEPLPTPTATSTPTDRLSL